MADRLDLLLLGATGFTGRHCIPYIHKLSKSNGRNLSWGVAGRSEKRLKQVLKIFGEKIEADLEKIPIVVVDIDNEESVKNMAQKAKIVINCCGPYRFLAEDVVKICIEAGTHHVDVSGEPEYMENVQFEQNDAAEKKGVYVVSACGFDSIPTDMGVVFLQQEFEGTLNSVISYLEIWEEGDKSSAGPGLNYATWESLVYGLGEWDSLRELRKKFPRRLPQLEPNLKMKILPHKSNVVDGWIVPFPGADHSVVKRSQHPKVFSAGVFSRKSPSAEKIKKTWFQVTFYGEGWKDKLANKDDKYTTPCDKIIMGRVKGKNPGYGTTCAAVVLAAIMIATESDKMPGKGGVLPPGAAFAKTSLIKELNENGVTFDIIPQTTKKPSEP